MVLPYRGSITCFEKEHQNFNANAFENKLAYVNNRAYFEASEYVTTKPLAVLIRKQSVRNDVSNLATTLHQMLRPFKEEMKEIELILTYFIPTPIEFNLSQRSSANS